jgi:hypothetical protein
LKLNLFRNKIRLFSLGNSRFRHVIDGDAIVVTEHSDPNVVRQKVQNYHHSRQYVGEMTALDSDTRQNVWDEGCKFYNIFGIFTNLFYLINNSQSTHVFDTLQHRK